MLRRAVTLFALMLAAGIVWPAQKPGDEKAFTPLKLEKGMTAPTLVEKIIPAYPADAKNEKVEGSVKLEVVINTKGEVVEVKTVESADPRLSTAATDAVKQWKFTPAKDKQGKPVQCKSSITVNFKLK